MTTWSSQELADRFEINDLLCRFQEAFDSHDWDLMRGCLAPEVRADYSSFRGTPAETMPADRFVALRREALQDLAMQHSFLNLRVELAGDSAAARCNYLIHRFPLDPTDRPGQFFHSYGHYRFQLARTQAGWRIAGITQALLSNAGDPALHSGARPGRGNQ